MENEQAVAEISPAPEPEATAAPETVETTPEEQQPSKTFTQDELDAIVGKRLAREQRKWEESKPSGLRSHRPRSPWPLWQTRMIMSLLSSMPEALAERKAHELLAQREAARQQAAIVEAYQELEETARDKYADFQQVAYNPNLPVTDVMAQTIQASEIGPDVIYWLGSNPKEAARISQLSPILQAREIGKIEAKLTSDPPVRKTSSAPAPIAPVAARTTGGASYDTTDPRSLKTMTTSEWIEAERQRQIRKLQAQQR